MEERTAELTASNERLRTEVQHRRRTEEALRIGRETLKHLLRASDHDRQLIAYDVHDGLAQHLAAAIMQFQAFAASKDREPHRAETAYATGFEMIRQAHAEARRLISGVRPPILDESGIIAAIDHLVHDPSTCPGKMLHWRLERAQPSPGEPISRRAGA